MHVRLSRHCSRYDELFPSRCRSRTGVTTSARGWEALGSYHGTALTGRQEPPPPHAGRWQISYFPQGLLSSLVGKMYGHQHWIGRSWWMVCPATTVTFALDGEHPGLVATKV